MKLLHVISSMDPKTGGPSQGLRNLNPFLTRSGITVEIVCLDNHNTNYKIEENVIIHKIGTGRTSYQYNKKLVRWLSNHISNFDYISIHGIWQYHNYAVNKVIKDLKKQNKKVPKVVIMPHGMLDPYFQKSKDRKIKALRNEFIWQITEKHCINSADAIFFTCQEEMELAKTTFKGYFPKREINVGYGIQCPPIYNDKMKTAFEKCCPSIKNKKYWLFLSRIDPKKGIDLLITVYNELVLERNDLPELVIAGPTESNYAKKMIELAKDNNKIHFSGMLISDSKWGAFYNCDTYILPSHQENFGIAIVEAMACKKPVLITKKVNLWREIDEGQGGWIINQPNSSDLKNTLNIIANLSKSEIEIKGQKANDTFEKNFLVDNCYENFINGLKSLK